MEASPPLPAALDRGLRPGIDKPDQRFPPPGQGVVVGYAPHPAQIRQIRAGGPL